MTDCIFCKIAAGEIPSDKIYEDDKVVAFRDIHPQAPVHFLVVPKEHIKSAADITPVNSDIVAHCFEVIAKLAVQKKLENGFRVINNCGENAGQTVPHIHFHVLAGKPLGETLV
ncbi:MAG: histidine triad nucleotide-binding protein [Firmicutes bacterium HGW-Firmicutes-16]|nr:MAG: histidine triad nucleotide-binding protein [Firmicutes bacterium HGW-Firmicutes-16]